MPRSRKRDLVDRVLLPPIYIDGYFADQYAQGLRPDYGVSSRGLPKVDESFSMHIVTGFMAARENK